MYINYRSLQIEPTNRCNLKCRVCWHTLGAPKGYGDLSFDLFKTIFSQFDGIQDLNLQGLGEPFLSQDLLNMISHVKHKKVDVWLTSNLNIDIDEKFARSIVKSGLTKIRISIDASSEKEYGKIKKRGSFKKVINAIRLINRIKSELSSDFPILAFNTIAMKRNIKDLQNIIKLAHSLGIYEIALIPLVIFNKGIATKNESLDNNIPLLREYTDGIFKTAQDLGIKLEEGISAVVHPKEMGLKTNEKPKCTYGCFVDCFGFLYPCCNVKYFLGNFRNENLSEMVNNGRYNFFEKNILQRKLGCSSCMEILNNTQVNLSP